MQTILSFDVDRTLVDRKKNSHTIAAPIRAAVLEAADTTDVRVVLNTGRDFGALKEIDFEFGRPLDAFFLSGRGERIDSKVSVNKDAVFGPEVISRLFDSAKEFGIPFLDVKIGDGVVNVTFSETRLPFGFQKPIDWFKNYRPIVLDGNCDSTLSQVSDSSPLRLEIPFKGQFLDELCASLALPGDTSIQLLPPHRDYLAAPDSEARDWEVLQIVSSVDRHNKGTSLRDFLRRLNTDARVVHFGDSSEHHNSDTRVSQVLPDTFYVHVDWESGPSSTVERQIVNVIREQFKR